MSERTNNTNNGAPGIVAALRSLVPNRRLTVLESLKIAELQANRLRELLAVTDIAFPTEMIADLPRIHVIERRDLPVSGASYWTPGSWVIALNRSEPLRRRRLTTLHEFKHILDHGQLQHLYRDSQRMSAEAQGESAADYFAGCVLVPRKLLREAVSVGIRRPSNLASLFEVSVPAIEVRLSQVGLSPPRPRCQPPTNPTRQRFRRTESSSQAEGQAA